MLNKKLEYLIECYKREDGALLLPNMDFAADEIFRRSSVVGQTVYYYPSASRLIEIARKSILDKDAQGKDFETGVVWWAGSLECAKGRMSRKWWAPEGGIYLCVSLFPELINENRGLYTLAVGVAVAEALRLWGVNVEIRWINDILLNKRKVAGILAESVFCPESAQEYLLFGIGINVNVNSFPSYLPEATSLLIETSRRWPLFALGAHVVARIALVFAQLHKWEADCIGEAQFEPVALNPVVSAFEFLSDYRGRRVVYGHDADLKPEFEAVAEYIKPDGSLLLSMENGSTLAVNSGEIRYIQD